LRPHFKTNFENQLKRVIDDILRVCNIILFAFLNHFWHKDLGKVESFWESPHFFRPPVAARFDRKLRVPFFLHQHTDNTGDKFTAREKTLPSEVMDGTSGGCYPFDD